MALNRQLGISDPAAWRMHDKLMSAMAHREDRDTLQGVIQMDDAYLVGKRTEERWGGVRRSRRRPWRRSPFRRPGTRSR